MTRWVVDERGILHVHEIQPKPRTFREQLRDEVLTLIAWAIPAGMLLALLMAWWYGEGR